LHRFPRKSEITQPARHCGKFAKRLVLTTYFPGGPRARTGTKGATASGLGGGAWNALPHPIRVGGKMLYYAVVFFIIALIAALFGFGGIAAGAAGIAKILFVVFLIVSLVTFLLSLARR
jgi:uncharacterized membrane protein YtjA (UPF0391 family)